ncbi:hypothetical protein 162286312 [Organic Lake phycodnavirus]|nr:hypothetical protein 162286312 [Organic Lake phycodnavirus]ADX06659.1 hypothetical protein 162309559 [Organic Lake phycodnavirus]
MKTSVDNSKCKKANINMMKNLMGYKIKKILNRKKRNRLNPLVKRLYIIKIQVQTKYMSNNTSLFI